MAKLYTTSPNGSSTCSMIVKRSEIFNEFTGRQGTTMDYYGYWTLLTNGIVLIGIHYWPSWITYVLPIDCDVRTACCNHVYAGSKTAMMQNSSKVVVDITWNSTTTYNDKVTFGTDISDYSTLSVIIVGTTR